MSTTSVTLLDQLRDRPSPDAWRRFVDIYSPILFRYTVAKSIPADAAADLVQDVFVVLLEKIHSFEYAGGGFRRWLFTILLNKWRDRYRAEARSPVVLAVDRLIEPPANDDPAAALGEAEYRSQVVARAIDLMQTEFEPVTWRACWEHGVMGRSAADVAAELGVSPNSVYLSTSRVLRRLRGSLRGLLD